MAEGVGRAEQMSLGTAVQASGQQYKSSETEACLFNMPRAVSVSNGTHSRQGVERHSGEGVEKASQLWEGCLSLPPLISLPCLPPPTATHLPALWIPPPLMHQTKPPPVSDASACNVDLPPLLHQTKPPRTSDASAFSPPRTLPLTTMPSYTLVSMRLL